MRVRIIGVPKGVVDGIDLARFLRGHTYDVSTTTGSLLLAEGWAQPVDDHDSREPALVIPFSQLDRHRVLVVEDDADFCDIVAQALRYHGFNVVAAQDGAEGLEALKRHRPSLVVLDLNLPRMSGKEFREAQQRLPDRKLADIPVIVVSARDDAIEQARRIGAAEVLQKPVDLDRLVRAIGRRVGRTNTRN